MESRILNLIISGGWLLFVIAIGLLLAVATAQASTECMTKAEARRAHPSEHLYWHGSAHCWDNRAGRSRPFKRIKFDAPVDGNGNAAHSASKPEFNEIDAQADKKPVIAYPALLPGQTLDPSMLAPEMMTAWPALIDVDLSPGFDPWQSRIAGAFQK